MEVQQRTLLDKLVMRWRAHGESFRTFSAVNWELLGQIPHIMVLEIVGAVIGRFYFRRKYGTPIVLRTVPIIMAGYFTGVGLISMATIALNLIRQAVSGTPF